MDDSFQQVSSIEIKKMRKRERKERGVVGGVGGVERLLRDSSLCYGRK